MKRICVAVVMFTALVFVATSCKKTKTDPVITPTMYIPANDGSYAASLMAPNNSSVIVGASISNVWGIFMTTGLTSAFDDTTGSHNARDEYWQEAFFCGTEGTGFISPKRVLLNNTGINQRGNGYFVSGNPWHSGWINSWGVTGDENVPEVSGNMDDAYPAFSGTVPANVSLTAGLSYTFVPAKIVYADSAYVLIHANGLVAKSNTVSVVAGANAVATISKDQMANMHNEYFTADNKVYYGAIMELVFYKDTIETFHNKQFAFVNQRVVARKVVFN